MVLLLVNILLFFWTDICIVSYLIFFIYDLYFL